MGKDRIIARLQDLDETLQSGKFCKGCSNWLCKVFKRTPTCIQFLEDQIYDIIEEIDT